MFRRIQRFATGEDGNAIIDWVVLMAGTILMAISVVVTITSNVEAITDDTVERVESMEDFSPG